MSNSVAARVEVVRLALSLFANSVSLKDITRDETECFSPFDPTPCTFSSSESKDFLHVIDNKALLDPVTCLTS